MNRFMECGGRASPTSGDTAFHTKEGRDQPVPAGARAKAGSSLRFAPALHKFAGQECPGNRTLRRFSGSCLPGVGPAAPSNLALALAAGCIALLLGLTIPTGAADQSPDPVPLTRAHAHNDYEHARPLFDALAEGFGSIEADIYLVDGQLLVAHDRDQVRATRTLQSLYLDPLVERIQQNGGRVYKGGPPVILLIDVKSEAEPTYRALRQVLEGYTNVLTCFSSAGVKTNALTAIVSGNRARALMAKESVRYAAIDGRPEDLNDSVPKDLVPLVSEDWTRLFKWRGSGPLASAERQRLVDLVDKAHRQGRKIRFWGTPDRAEFWQVLWNAGVDLLNADDLPGLRKFILAQRGSTDSHIR